MEADAKEYHIQKLMSFAFEKTPALPSVASNTEDKFL